MTPGTRHLLDRLLAVQERIEVLVARRRAGDHQSDDPFRGLYVDDAMVDLLLARPGPGEPATGVGTGDGTDDGEGLGEAEESRIAGVERAADELEAAGHRLPLRELERVFALSPLDVEILLVALACEVDPRLELLFGYLADDVSRRRPTVAVALALCGRSVASAAARHALQHGPLVESGLLRLEEAERPLPSRGLRVPDRVVDHLLGSRTPDAALRDLLGTADPLGWGDGTELAAALALGQRLVHLREGATGSGRLLAVDALARVGREPLLLEAAVLAQQPDAEELARIAVREVLLSGAGLVICDVAALAERPAVLRRLLDVRATVVTVGTVAWDPEWSDEPALRLRVPESTVAERAGLWRHTLNGVGGGVGFAVSGGVGVAAGVGPHAGDHAGAAATGATVDGGDDAMAAAAPFRLRPEQVVRAARTARQLAVVSGSLTPEHVRQGALGENGSALERLARRITPAVAWGDLVLPPAVLGSLREISLRARHRERVLGDWRMRPGGGRGIGVSALFAGDSGTGKTMSAEVVAADLGLELYVVDLATVVSKYIGETEKNIEKILSGATGVNAVLLFDEADALFGRRTEVKDSHDRYANLESAYLLQRLESFDGLCILATNLRANIDEAFTRRLDVLVDFPLPDADHRRALWDRSLGSALPREVDVDLDFCAEAFELAGGAIRSAAITAAYLAAADGGRLAMAHVVTGVHRELRKLGRLTIQQEFGPYWELVDR